MGSRTKLSERERESEGERGGARPEAPYPPARLRAGRERRGVEVDRAVATGAGEDDRDTFPGNPLELLFSFYSGPFPFYFLFY